jgi:hypothetical protein
MVLYANAALQGALLGMQKALCSLKVHGLLTEEDGTVVTFKERQRLVQKGRFDDLETRYSSVVPTHKVRGTH